MSDEDDMAHETAAEAILDWLKIVTIDGPQVFAGEVAWDLWSTYGLPIEITRDICKERGFVVDEVGYEAAKKRHRAISQHGDEK